MRIINKNISEIKEYKNNPRINDKAAEAVANSIREFGFKVPIIIDGNNVIVAGHTRFKAAQRLKLETVPCIVADDLTEEQIKAFRLADNKTAELAEWDIKLLFPEIEQLRAADYDIEKLGFGEKELKDIADEYAQLLDAETEAEEDAYNLELPEEPKTKPGDLYILGGHRLLCGDATKAECYTRLMDGAVADLLLTDVPYNVDYGNKMKSLSKYRPNARAEHDIINDKMSNEEYEHFLSAFIKYTNDVLKDGAAFYIWNASAKTDAMFSAIHGIENISIKQVLMWVKNHFVLGRQDYQWKHEPCLYG